MKCHVKLLASDLLVLFLVLHRVHTYESILTERGNKNSLIEIFTSASLYRYRKEIDFQFIRK